MSKGVPPDCGRSASTISLVHANFTGSSAQKAKKKRFLRSEIVSESRFAQRSQFAWTLTSCKNKPNRSLDYAKQGPSDKFENTNPIAGLLRYEANAIWGNSRKTGAVSGLPPKV